MSKLVHYIRRAGVPEVILKVSQVAAVIGDSKARELCIWINQGQEVQTKYNRSPRSSVPAKNKVTSDTLGCYKTIELLEAMGETPLYLPHSGIPNHSLLPSEKAAELQARGILKDDPQQD